MRLGFTGTRSGMTDAQKETVRTLLGMWLPGQGIEFHHGDCKGADAEAVELARAAGFEIAKHPSDIEAQTAHTLADVTFDPKPPLERNHDIVDAIDALIACPKGFTEELRSGTWATIRYARKQGRLVMVVLPSGMTEMREG